ncbi:MULTISPECIES: hypothetical protein [Hyphomonas]|uniref:Uncharacterized protein n=1 Tax=Hyphomonas adhaerens TaxID=81029 RepID=A0A3B9H0K4_9PROT|nr:MULTISPECIES: hypothetical protein [Hyphomonas]MBB40982.1 hypothetical protein [Hyphomonas sp.]HAE28225.1 hypothetical protein [Hyphomonas adhaerens]|tara:strand:+ start:1419 stop:1760 length:342 start_codon:yes stop_codon:yes gene_type:complete
MSDVTELNEALKRMEEIHHEVQEAIEDIDADAAVELVGLMSEADELLDSIKSGMSAMESSVEEAWMQREASPLEAARTLMDYVHEASPSQADQVMDAIRNRSDADLCLHLRGF